MSPVPKYWSLMRAPSYDLSSHLLLYRNVRDWTTFLVGIATATARVSGSYQPDLYHTAEPQGPTYVSGTSVFFFFRGSHFWGVPDS